MWGGLCPPLVASFVWKAKQWQRQAWSLLWARDVMRKVCLCLGFASLLGGKSAHTLRQPHKKTEKPRTPQNRNPHASFSSLTRNYAIAQPELIDGLERLKNSFNSYPIDRIALAGATAAVEDAEYLQEICDKTIATREWTVSELEKLGFEVLPSATNFVFVTHPEKDAETLYLSLKEQGILVRYFGKKPRIGEYLRITIGTDAEMQALIEALSA